MQTLFKFNRLTIPRQGILGNSFLLVEFHIVQNYSIPLCSADHKVAVWLFHSTFSRISKMSVTG